MTLCRRCCPRSCTLRRFLPLGIFLIGCAAWPSPARAQHCCGENHSNQGVVLSQSGRPQEAVSCTSPARSQYYYGENYTNQGIVLFQAGRSQEAIPWFTCALQVDSRDVNAYRYRGYAWSILGQYDAAIADLTQALQRDPALPGAYFVRGSAWNKKGEYETAIADFNRALAFNPSLADAYVGRGLAWAGKREYDRAIADMGRALMVTPNNTIAWDERGNIWEQRGQYAKAISDYEGALAVNPNSAAAYNHLGRLRATCPDPQYRNGREALANARWAYQLTGGKDASVLATLAAAYAESGDFAQAEQWQTKAVALAPSEVDKQNYRARSRMYQARRPYREEPGATIIR